MMMKSLRFNILFDSIFCNSPIVCWKILQPVVWLPEKQKDDILCWNGCGNLFPQNIHILCSFGIKGQLICLSYIGMMTLLLFSVTFLKSLSILMRSVLFISFHSFQLLARILMF